MNLTAFHLKFIIWLTVRPTWVAISGTEKPLSAGKSYAIECTTSGSRPSANIHWYLHSIQQQAAKERVRCRPVHFSSTFSQSFQFKFQKIITGGFPCRWRWTDATRRAHWSWFRRPRITTPNWSAPPSIRQWLRRRIATSAEVTTREIIWPQGLCPRRRRSKLDENLSSIVRRTNELIFVLFFLVFLLFSFSLFSLRTSNSLSLITNDTLLDEDEDVDNGDDEIFNNGIRRRRRRRSLLGNGEGILFFFQGGIQENKSSIFPSPFIRKRERRNPIPQHQRREKEQDAHFYFLFRVVWRLCVSSCLLTGWNISGHSGMNDIRAALQNGARKVFRPEIEGKSQLTDNRRANSDTVINFFLFFYWVLWDRMCGVGISTLIPRPLAAASFETELRAKIRKIVETTR